jgi:hypothetical protein
MLTMKIKCEWTVSPERVADMFIGAIEGGSTYWCAGIYWQDYDTPWPVNTQEPGVVAYADPTLYTREDFKFEVLEIENEVVWDGDRPNAPGLKRHTITSADILKGLQLMADEHNSHFRDLMNENDDATTADVFLQLVVLGDVVYG